MQRLKSKKSILWIAYGLCTLLLLTMQTGFFNRITIKGAGPLIVPVCVGKYQQKIIIAWCVSKLHS